MLLRAFRAKLRPVKLSLAILPTTHLFVIAPSSQKLLQQLQIQGKNYGAEGKREPQNIYIGRVIG